MFLFALFRVSLIPVLMLCNVAPSVRSHLEVLLPSDAAFVFFVAIFSFSDGYINNVAMMFGPKSSGAESGLQASKRRRKKIGHILLIPKKYHMKIKFFIFFIFRRSLPVC